MKIIKGKQSTAQKVVVYGPEGIGKSTFASQFPKPIFIDTEGSTNQLDVDRFPVPSSWTMLNEQIKWILSDSLNYKTIVIDTADWAEKLAIEHTCATLNINGIEDLGYGKGYVYVLEDWGRMLNKLEEVIDRGVNVVLLAHAMMRKFEQPDEMGAYDRWELKLNKKVSALTKEWADMVLFANYKTVVITDPKTKSKKASGGQRVMYTTHHPAWDAKNREGMPEELPFSYESIREVIMRVYEQEPKAQISETTENEKANQFTETTYFRHAKEKWCTCFDAGDEVPGPEDQVFQNLEPIAKEQYEAWMESQKELKIKDHVSTVTPEKEKNQEPELIPFDEALPTHNRALNDLMMANAVTVPEIQQVVALRGYYPANTPIENYDDQFIDGVLVGAWTQVFQMIQTEIRK